MHPKPPPTETSALANSHLSYSTIMRLYWQVLPAREADILGWSGCSQPSRFVDGGAAPQNPMTSSVGHEGGGP